MKNSYPLNRTWRYVIIFFAVALFLMMLIPPLFAGPSGSVSETVIIIVVTGGISGGVIYLTLTGKIVTSPEGISCVSFGSRFIARWDQIDRLEVNPFEAINLVFKEPLYSSRLPNKSLGPLGLGYTQSVRLSPYIEDVSTSNLLKDIAAYVPDSNAAALLESFQTPPALALSGDIPEMSQLRMHHLEPYQKASMILMYYIAWMVGMVLMMFVFRKVEDALITLGYPNAVVVSYMITMSLMIGLMIKGSSLLGYNARVMSYDERQIVRLARGYYLFPLLMVGIGLLIGLITVVVLHARSVVISRDELRLFAPILFLIGFAVAAISEKIARWQDAKKVQTTQ